MKRLLAIFPIIITVFSAHGQKVIQTEYSSNPRYQIALTIYKWMGNKSIPLPISKEELKKLADYKMAGYREVVFCPGAVSFVHLHKGKVGLRIGDIRTEGGSFQDVDIGIVGKKIVSIGPDCDESEDSRISPMRRTVQPSEKTATSKKGNREGYLTDRQIDVIKKILREDASLINPHRFPVFKEWVREDRPTPGSNWKEPRTTDLLMQMAREGDWQLTTERRGKYHPEYFLVNNRKKLKFGIGVTMLDHQPRLAINQFSNLYSHK